VFCSGSEKGYGWLGVFFCALAAKDVQPEKTLFLPIPPKMTRTPEQVRKSLI
jgi:hypothetical protein